MIKSTSSVVFSVPVRRTECHRISEESFRDLISAINTRRNGIDWDSLTESDKSGFLFVPDSSFAEVGVHYTGEQCQPVATIPDLKWDGNVYRQCLLHEPHRGWYHSAGQTALQWVFDGHSHFVTGTVSPRFAEEWGCEAGWLMLPEPSGPIVNL